MGVEAGSIPSSY